MKYIIFYSWESDLPNNTNRGFIESVIKKAIKGIQKTEEYELDPTIDKDTQGIPGAPNITQAILDKIKICDAFVADISIVTGSKENGQRPSPNPNVLLELGYAIALLGWAKIILFCNDVYGTDEDLPFDIRQHRRIGYKLLQDDPKSEVRNNLASHFKERLVELLQKGKSNSLIKQPFLTAVWNYWDIEENFDSDVGIDTKNIDLHCADDVSDFKRKVEQEIIKAEHIDGSIDVRWGEKLEQYIVKANEFINELNDEGKYKKFLMGANAAKTYPITLTVENGGNAKASDIRIKFELPDWLLAFKEFPNKNEVPKRPSIPSPVATRATNIHLIMGDVAYHSNIVSDNSLMMRNINCTSACHLKANYISFWADHLLHKHSITNRSDRIYLLAMPNSPKGKVVLKGKSFCSEYDDWQEIELSIKVV